MKKTAGILLALTFFLLSQGQAMAISRDDAVSTYSQELSKLGVGDPDGRAENEVDALIKSMESDQYDVQVAVENLDTQVSTLSKTSNRRDSALSALDTAKERVQDFTGQEADEHVKVQPAIAGALPYVTPDENFVSSRDSANSTITAVRRIMISPDRPGAVPTGDIVTDFIPQIIRQLFRFAWVAVFIAFTASGVMLVLAQGDEDRLGKAKSMIYYSLLGFAFVAFAFAIVKGVTDIDFFRFI